MFVFRNLLLFFVSVFLVAEGVAQERVDFNRDIRPILASKCYLCHGPDEDGREADLRLDLFDEATKDLGDYAALVPGRPDESELLTRILSEDPDLRMPPAEHGDALSKDEIERIRNWIQSGGKYDRHWSYKRIERPAVPHSRSDWGKNEIDQFVIRRLTNAGLEPEPEADRYSLIRRIALDLTGVPPSVEVADRFARDSSPSAVEKVIDYYLNQPGFGERWSAMWLDQARYADTMGYAEDRPREIWAYRDYVIRSFNENKSFRDFTIEQLAGDLLPNPTDEQRVATAFHRNTLTNTEGGTIDEEFRSAAVVDRTNTTMAVWMGSTMACAQCHTHKYDPISQKEYFQFYAFFNGTEDNDHPSDRPRHSLYTSDNLQKRNQLENAIVELKKRLTRQQTKEVRELELLKWEAVLFSSKPLPVKARFVRIEIPGRQKILSLAEVVVHSQGSNVALNGKVRQSSVANGPAKLAIDGNREGDFQKKSVTHTRTEENPWWLLDLGKETQIDKIEIFHRTDNGLHSRSNRMQLSLLDASKSFVSGRKFESVIAKGDTFVPNSIPDSVDRILRKWDSRTLEEQRALESYFVAIESPEIAIQTQLSLLQAQLNQIRPRTSVPVLSELPAEKQRKTHIHIRGSYAAQGAEVERGVPAVFPALSAQKRPSRVDLAKWLVSRDNPLTARVIVNRFWQQLFGVGIVATSEEFGSQGEWPSHPELLDFLAVEFMDSGWDVKQLLKKIMLSATYQQSSNTDSAKREADPYNRLFSRGPRFRMTAEMVRDQALASSGLLSSKMFGPPVQPPQPKTGLKAAFQTRGTDWVDSVGEDRYRRAIYTRWQRSNPYPSMTTFDVSNREVCEVRRLRTNTPLQALVTLNDPAFFEAAQALGRMAYQSRQDSKQQVEFMFRRVMIRPPTSAEVEILTGAYQNIVAEYKSKMEAAMELANDPLHPMPESTDWASLAGLVSVANVIMNLDETLMRR